MASALRILIRLNSYSVAIGFSHLVANGFSYKRILMRLNLASVALGFSHSVADGFSHSVAVGFSQRQLKIFF
jgi:formate/nitrite transporter FocA (FNT family)